MHQLDSPNYTNSQTLTARNNTMHFVETKKPFVYVKPRYGTLHLYTHGPQDHS